MSEQGKLHGAGRNSRTGPARAFGGDALSQRLRAARNRLGAGTPSGPPPGERPERLVPSFAQERLWLLDRLAVDSTEYNVHQLVRLRGALDLDALERGLTAVVDRHEVLRTVYADEEGSLRPRVLPSAPVRITTEDLHAEPPSHRERAAMALARAAARRAGSASRSAPAPASMPP
ncbi:condensation domain-containing protein [Streptosporangium sp. NPDC001682]